MKKQISVCINSSSLDLEGPIEQAVAYLQKEQKDALGKGYTDIRLAWTCEYEDYRYYLYGSREETDLEYTSRISVEERHKLFLEQRERAEFDRLKKKFSE